MQWGHILVEGQTEFAFVRDILNPYLERFDFTLTPILIKTAREASGKAYKGGYTTYASWKKRIRLLLSDSSTLLVTTMLDFYQLPRDFPGVSTQPKNTCFQRVSYLEKSFADDIDSRKFIPYLALHEFEAMLFAAPEQITELFPEHKMTGALKTIRAQFESPEEIDDDAPPSKRIQTLIPEYQKPLSGPLIAQSIGLDRIRAECQHLNHWLEQLEALVQPGL